MCIFYHLYRQFTTGALVWIFCITPLWAQSTLLAQTSASLTPTPTISIQGQQVISMSIQSMTIKKALRLIARKAGMGISFDSALIPDKIVNVTLHNVSVEEALRQVLNNTGIEAIIHANGTIMLIAKQTTSYKTPDRVVQGKVTDDKGEPLPGVNILIKGRNTGAITDADGNFSIISPDEATTLIFSYVGYTTQEINVKAPTSISVQLIADNKSLEEVVVIGYGTANRKTLTSSISKVEAKDIENQPVTNFLQALQGQATGVLITSRDGVPGSPAEVRIRGINSISTNRQANDPLYVVDGVPLFANYFDNTTGSLSSSPLSQLNPNDIASIEILKDAAATAIYGSRAANGVVLITTKSGQQGRSQVDVNGYIGASFPGRMIEALNTEEYLMIRREAFRNDNIIPNPQNAPDFFLLDSTTYTNWGNELFENALLQQYQLNVNGGGGNTVYYLSGGYRNEEATFHGDYGLKRANLRINVDHTHRNRLKIGTRLSYSGEKNRRMITGFANRAVYAVPNLPAYTASGDLNLIQIPGVENPWEPYTQDNTSTSTQFIGSGYLDFKIMEGLNLKGDFSYQSVNFNDNNYLTRLSIFAPTGRGGYGDSKVNTFVVEPQLNFQRTFANNHRLQIFVGGTYQQRNAENRVVYGVNYPNDYLKDFNSFGQILFKNGSITQYNFASIFNRINYSFREKYLFDGTFRRDGSSRFGPGNQFGNFWAVGIGWVFSEEGFMKNIPFLSLGKLRTSYGVTGSDQFGDYQYLSLRNASASFYDGIAGTRPIGLSNPELQWEETRKFDAGIELSLFNNRIDFTLNYFLNRSDNQLFSRPIAGQTGFTSIQDNLDGLVENRGWELDLSASLFESPNFTWNVRFNATRLKNELIRLPGLETSGLNKTYQIGQPLQLLWGYQFLGVNPETGNASFEDFDGNGIPNEPGDFIVIGKLVPDYTGGFSNSFSYKGLSLDILFQFVEGVDGRTEFGQFLGNSRFNMYRRMLERWQNPGDITDVPRATAPGSVDGRYNTQIAKSSQAISDGSYLRLKNVTLAYNLNRGLISRLGLQNTRFYISGQNLLTFTNYEGFDPENTYVDATPLPVPRLLIGGIDLTF